MIGSPHQILASAPSVCIYGQVSGQRRQHLPRSCSSMTPHTPPGGQQPVSVAEVTLRWKRSSCLHLGPGQCTQSAVGVVGPPRPAFSSPHPGSGLAGASSTLASWSLLWVTDATLSSASLGLSRAGQTPQRTCPSQLGCQKGTVDAVAFPGGLSPTSGCCKARIKVQPARFWLAGGHLPCVLTRWRVSSRPFV